MLTVNAKTAATSSARPMMGSSTSRQTRQGDAPSTAAASRQSGFSPRSAGSSVRTTNGKATSVCAIGTRTGERAQVQRRLAQRQQVAEAQASPPRCPAAAARSGRAGGRSCPRVAGQQEGRHRADEQRQAGRQHREDQAVADRQPGRHEEDRAGAVDEQLAVVAQRVAGGQRAARQRSQRRSTRKSSSPSRCGSATSADLARRVRAARRWTSAGRRLSGSAARACARV